MVTSEKGVAVIIGAASGIGRALATECRDNGYQLALADIDAAKLKATASSISDAAFCEAIDVSDMNAMQNFADSVISRYEHVEILINSAGVFTVGSILEQDIEQWKWVMDVNFGGVLNSVKAFAPQMMASQKPSHIVNIASIMGLLTAPKTASYCASKHAVVAFSESLQLECRLAKSNIKVSVVCPGAVATDILNPNRYENYSNLSAHAEQTLNKIKETSDADAMSAQEHAKIVFKDMTAGKFWILPHKDMLDQIDIRAKGILNQTDPAFLPVKKSQRSVEKSK